MDILKKESVLFDIDVASKDELFAEIAKLAVKDKLVESEATLIKGFQDRENLDSTAFEDGFAIPHARTSDVKKAGAFFVRLKKPIAWDKEGKMVDVAIMLIIPESKGDYLDILSGIATKLMDKTNRDTLKKSTDKSEIVKLLMEQQKQKESVVAKSKNAIKIVGISACATGVVHTYMARDAILEAGKKLNWTVAVETQGQKGQEFALTQKEIDEADAVILAVDIAVDLDRFAGRKIYKVGTKVLIEDPETQVRYAVSKGKVLTKEAADAGGAFTVKNGRAWIQHIMSGISFMIPFIVFSGIIFAIVTGVGKIIYGSWLDYSGAMDGSHNEYIQTITKTGSTSLKSGAFVVGGQALADIANGTSIEIQINGVGISILYYLNTFANIGFGVMIPIMGAYIANSIAGRSAIAPAFILTSAGTSPSSWWHWGPFHMTMDNPLFPKFSGDETTTMDKLFPGNGGGIFAALLFGFVIGYTVKWINTKWRINKYVKPIMPIIIIPVFVSLFYGVITIYLLGNIFGLLIGYVNLGLQEMEASKAGMALLGLVLGMIAGIDMGGPINKIASFGATAMIAVDGGKAMGCAAAAFAIAPMGAGICTQIFRKKFKDDQGLGVNATVLGFMGISEGAIPFAAKYTWAAFIPNIICSGLAGMFAGIFQVSGWVGAWGGPIIAIFGGVTTWGMSYVGILWYFVAIAIGIAAHIVIFRILVELKTDEGRIGSVKSIHTEFVLSNRKAHEAKVTELKEQIFALQEQRYNEVKSTKLSGGNVESVKANFASQISAKKAELKSLNQAFRAKMANEKQAYKTLFAQEKQALKQNSADIKTFKTGTRQELKDQMVKLRVEMKNAKTLSNKKAIIDEKASVRRNINDAMDNRIIKNEEYMAKYSKPMYEEFNKKVQAL